MDNGDGLGGNKKKKKVFLVQTSSLPQTEGMFPCFLSFHFSLGIKKKKAGREWRWGDERRVLSSEMRAGMKQNMDLELLLRCCHQSAVSLWQLLISRAECQLESFPDLLDLFHATILAGEKKK